ncbi:hypothetical protein M3649_03920 [Ureibacillus chungkukjangi]|uniref:hypothetical protein n=1 Tax=Ureibacillus chungkukjangi TaxID=1202712 RepID=UPI00203D23CE|nr:hypothetical protein [Ureibacillus chungkukjangi]MCM3387279.1 hypothetical protein [Ureibacillus chungkukjangi]
MDFKMVKELSFHFSMDEKELIALYTLLQKLNFGYNLKIKEFELSEDERDLIEWLDKMITHSDANNELKLQENNGELTE